MNIRNVVCRTKKNVDDLLICPTKQRLEVSWVLVHRREATEHLLQARRDDLRTIFES